MIDKIWVFQLVLLTNVIPWRIYCAPLLTLTSQPLTSGTYCPGPVTFTCVGTDVGGSLFWEVNGSPVASHPFRMDDTFPRLLTIDPPLDGVIAEITSAVINQNDNYDVVSILNVSDVSVLMEASLQCLATGSESNLFNVQIISPLVSPPSPPINCSLLPSPGGVEVSLQWSPSFTSQYAVERYRVSVNPNPSSCSSDQVSFGEDYNCSGLVLGENYNFIISASNCVSEGSRINFDVRSKVPMTPAVQLNHDKAEITVRWNVEPQTFVSGPCVYDDTISFTVILMDSEGVLMEQRVVTSDSCNEGECFVSFTPASESDVTYEVRITATNIFGSSNSTDSICPKRITPANIGLLVAGVLLYLLAIIVYAATVWYFVVAIKTLHDEFKSFNSMAKLRFSLLVINTIILVILLILWISTGIRIGSNPCDSEWSSARDALIILNFVIALVFLCLVIVFAVVEYLDESSKASRDNEVNPSKFELGIDQPKWEQDNKHNVCQAEDCSNKFITTRWTNDGYRRHHCRACGQVVCKDCLEDEAYLAYCNKTKKVCPSCKKKLDEGSDTEEQGRN